MVLICVATPVNHPFPPNLLIARELVPSFIVESVIQSSSKSVQPVLCYSLIKSFVSLKKFFAAVVFSSFFFIFIAHFRIFIFRLSFCIIKIGCLILFLPIKLASAFLQIDVRIRDATIHNLGVSIYCHLCITIQRYIVRYNQV